VDEARLLVTELRRHLHGHPDALLASPATGFTWCTATRQVDALLGGGTSDPGGLTRDSLGLTRDEYLVELRYPPDRARRCRWPSAAAHARFNPHFLPFSRDDRWGMTLHLSKLEPACQEAIVVGLPFPDFTERLLGVPPPCSPAAPRARVQARLKCFKDWLDTRSPAEKAAAERDLDVFMGAWP